MEDYKVEPEYPKARLPQNIIQDVSNCLRSNISAEETCKKISERAITEPQYKAILPKYCKDMEEYYKHPWHNWKAYLTFSDRIKNQPAFAPGGMSFFEWVVVRNSREYSLQTSIDMANELIDLLARHQANFWEYEKK